MIYSALIKCGYSPEHAESAINQIKKEAWEEGMHAFETAYDQDHHDPWSFLPDNPYA